MSNVKLIRNLTMGEIDEICNSLEGCAKCPLLISSYNKKIRCLKDDKVEMYEVEEVYKLLNSKINLDTNKVIV